MSKSKIVIIINGRGGVGKDALCDLAAKHYEVMNVSSITPVKTIAEICGWDGTKDAKSRKFLSDLKRVLTDFNDFPTNYLFSCYQAFLKGNSDIMFAHIREGSEIEKFRNLVVGCPCLTLLVRRNQGEEWGNSSDDEVENFSYDLEFSNNGTLEEAERKFVLLLESVLKR